MGDNNPQEEVELDLGQVEPEVEDSTFGFEIDTGEEEPKPEVNTEEMESRLAALEAEKNALSQKADSNAQLTQTFSSLIEQLKGGNLTHRDPPSSDETGPQIDWAALEKQVNDQAFKNPFQAQVAALNPILTQFKGQLDKEISEIKSKSQLVDSKMAMGENKDLAEVYTSYKDEVDNIAKKSLNYVEAARQVQLNHMEDYKEKMKAELLEELKKELVDDNKKLSTKQPTFTNSGNMESASNRAKATNKVKVRPEVLAAMHQFALNKGLDWNDPEIKEDIYNDYRAAGYIK